MAEGSARGKVDRAEPSKTRRSWARRVAESKATIPHHYLGIEAELAGAGEDPLPVLVRAAAVALRDVPALNGAYRDGATERYSRVNIGVVMEGPDAPAIPTLFDADRAGAPDLADRLAELRERAAEGALTGAETAGATFFLVPAGDGIDFCTPVIPGALAGALGLGWSSSGNGRIRVSATLAADARAIDTATAARYMTALRGALEAAGDAD